jgi:hypothetical protein
MNQKQKQNMKKKTLLPLIISVFLVVVFSVLQALESKSATSEDSVTLSTTVATTISLGCGSDVDLGTLTPGTPVPTTDQHTTCTTTTNADDGYDLKVKRNDSDTTMDKTDDATTNITDKTTWDPTANSGDGNADVYTGTGLGFSVYASTATKNATWWGAGTTYNDALNKYAGLPPTTYTLIMDHDSYASGSTTTSIAYRLDVPSTQRAGSYDGIVDYQAVSKP